jgi:hypothetical protein
MRKEKELITLLRSLVGLLAEETNRNPDFADKLDQLLSAIPARSGEHQRKVGKNSVGDLPDLHAEHAARGEAEFVLWLQSLPVAVLRSLIRANDFDPTRRTSKWNDAEKLATFIVDGLRARMARGKAFLNRGQT